MSSRRADFLNSMPRPRVKISLMWGLQDVRWTDNSVLKEPGITPPGHWIRERGAVMSEAILPRLIRLRERSPVSRYGP